MTIKEIDQEMYIKLYTEGKSVVEFSELLGINRRTLERYEFNLRRKKLIPPRQDLEIIKDNVRLGKKVQKFMDSNRIERKAFRQYAKWENAMVNYDREIIELLKKHSFPKNVKTKNNKITGEVEAIFQITDAHFNELVDLEFNQYDFNEAAKRLKKEVDVSKKIFDSFGVKKVWVAMTGDMLNSDRKLDELLSQSTNRAKATFLAVCLLEQVILDLNKDYQIDVIHVVGNESRLYKDFGWVDIVATDNYDYTIYNILKLLFRKTDVCFKGDDSVELVEKINGQNILFLHGYKLGSKMEQSIQGIIGKYTNRGIIIRFVVSGHLHSCRIGDMYARGSSIVGSNAYSDSGLQLAGRASQNIHLVYKNGDIHSMKVDLQNVDGITGYPIEIKLAEYNAKSLSKVTKTNI